MNEYFSQVWTHLTSPIRMIGALSAAVFFGFIGPFGTFVSLNLTERLFFWAAIVVISVVAVQLVKVAVNTKYSHLTGWKQSLILSSILVVTLAPLLLLFTSTIVDDRKPYFAPFWVFVVLTFGLTNFVIYLQHLLGFRTFKERPLLYQRLEDPNTKEIYRLTVRDHYVDVYSERGKETLLMRFGDALAELEGQDGRQVHRSHWVSCDAVQNIRKENGRMFLSLADGSEVPVSRAKQDGCLAEFQLLHGRGTA